jgi:hypothetical protein
LVEDIENNTICKNGKRKIKTHLNEYLKERKRT